MTWWAQLRASLFGRPTPTYDGTGSGRRAMAWQVGNPGAVAALAFSQNELRAKSRDLVRRNAWAAAGVEAFVANAIGTGIKPQSMVVDPALREAIQALWRDWCDEADARGLTDFYGLQALACRAMLEGGECLVRLRYRRPEDRLAVALQLQVLEPEHLPTTMNRELASGNVIRAGIEFDRLGRRVAYHLYRSHPGRRGAGADVRHRRHGDGAHPGASEIIHLFRPLRPGQIRGEPWLARALVKLNELDQYDDAELVRKKTAAMFAGFITRLAPEDNLMGEGLPDEQRRLARRPGARNLAAPGARRGHQVFSRRPTSALSYAEFLRMQFRAVAAAMGITYEMLTGRPDPGELLVDPRRPAGVPAPLSRRSSTASSCTSCAARSGRPGWSRQRSRGTADSAGFTPPAARVPGREVDPARLAVGRPEEGVRRDADGDPRRSAVALGGDLGLRLRRRGHRSRDRRRQPARGRARSRSSIPTRATTPDASTPVTATPASSRVSWNPRTLDMQLVHLASRLYGTPLLIARAKLDVILAVLGAAYRSAEV